MGSKMQFSKIVSISTNKSFLLQPQTAFDIIANDLYCVCDFQPEIQ